MVDIILDIDSAGDDILAVLYGALHKDINLLGITTVCGASGSIEQATWVAINTLDIADRLDIPVYSGAEKPLRILSKDELDAPVHFDKELEWKFGNRLDKFNSPALKPRVDSQKDLASDYICSTFSERPREIILVTTGPLTNIAEALIKDPNLANNVKSTFVLGGCFKTPGNITPITEYNIWADPEAAKIVFNSGMPITLVPLDVCENNAFASGMMTRDHIADLVNEGSGKVVDFINDKFPIYIDIWREFFQLAGFPMDDVMTLALAVDDSLGKYTDNTYVDIECEGKLSRGQTVAYFGKQIFKLNDDNPKNIRITESIDGKRFMNKFVDTMLKR